MKKMSTKGEVKYGDSKLQTPFGCAMVKTTGGKGKGGKSKGAAKPAPSKY